MGVVLTGEPWFCLQEKEGEGGGAAQIQLQHKQVSIHSDTDVFRAMTSAKSVVSTDPEAHPSPNSHHGDWKQHC